ncbi:MAG TPA: EAL domain-containing protein [Thermoanaerobaculia bacterium]|jgi:EAL domain-containing protein (putative c-di-GMP-specific phosphodiesterase class I)|nr:EAL domain-containing protein [Thermoanaerobaculia bacterium]
MMQSLIDLIFTAGNTHVAFQPIFAIQGEPELHSFECLTRGPEGTSLQSAEVLFEYVRRKGCEPAVDRLCVTACLRLAGRWPGFRYSLNVHAATLERDRDFGALLLETAALQGLKPSRLIVELVEFVPAFSEKCEQAISSLRQQGVEFALDDIGCGQANYQMILRCQPNYFKVDRYIVAGSSSDPSRRAVLSSICQMAHDMGGKVVAEGVESEADLAAVRSVGVDLAQGFLLGKPGEVPATERYLATG